MQTEPNQTLSEPECARIRAFDRLATRLGVKHCGGMPIAYVNYQHGLCTERFRHREATTSPRQSKLLPRKPSPASNLNRMYRSPTRCLGRRESASSPTVSRRRRTPR